MHTAGWREGFAGGAGTRLVADVEGRISGFSAFGPAEAAAYSTVTVLARLRGWSTFSPRARAM